MKQSLVLLCLLVGMMFACKNDAGSESGLTSITVSSLDKINEILMKKGVLTSDQVLDYFSITISNTAGTGCTTEKIVKTKNDSNSSIQLKTGDNDSCVYKLEAKYGFNEDAIRFEGDTGIGPGTRHEYSEGNSINVQIDIHESGSNQTVATGVTAATSVTKGTNKNVDINVCYDDKCTDDNKGSTQTTTTSASSKSITSSSGNNSNDSNLYSDSNDPCVTQIKNMQGKMSNNTYFTFCYRSNNSQQACSAPFPNNAANYYTGPFGRRVRAIEYYTTGYTTLTGCKQDSNIHKYAEKSKQYPTYFLIYRPQNSSNIYVKAFQEGSSTVANSMKSYETSVTKK